MMNVSRKRHTRRRQDKKKKTHPSSDTMSAFEKHRAFLRSHPSFRMPGRGYTYDPSTGKHYDATDPHDRKEMLKKYSKKGKALYVVANTNNNISQKTLNQARRLGKGRAFIGGYTGKKGKQYTDTSFPVSGITDKKAKKLKRQFEQESVMKIHPDARKKPVFL